MDAIILINIEQATTIQTFSKDFLIQIKSIDSIIESTIFNQEVTIIRIGHLSDREQKHLISFVCCDVVNYTSIFNFVNNFLKFIFNLLLISVELFSQPMSQLYVNQKIMSTTFKKSFHFGSSFAHLVDNRKTDDRIDFEFADLNFLINLLTRSRFCCREKLFELIQFNWFEILCHVS